MGSLRYRVRDHAVNAYRREEQSQTAKSTEQNRMKAPIGEGLGDDLFHSLKVSYGEITINGLQSTAKCGNWDERNTLRSNYEVRLVGLGSLCVREVHRRLRWGSQSCLADVTYNSGDFPRGRLRPRWSHWLADPNAFANRIFALPEHICHRLINDHNGF